MRALPLLFVLGCAPRIPPGPIAVEQWTAPVAVLEMPDPTSPNIYLQATVHAGSAHDPVGAEGLAHLVARSLVDAGAGERSSTEVRDALYPTGNQFGLVVERETVSLRLRCHADHQAICVELFADALVAPRFDEDDVLRLRDEATYAVGEGLLSDEEALGQEMLNAVLYEAHPYGHPVQGRTGTLPQLTATDGQDFHREHYVRQSVSVGVAGAYSPETVEKLRNRLDQLPGTRAPELPLQQPLPFEGRSAVIVRTGTDVTGIHFGHPNALSRNHPDWPAMTVAMSAVGAHRQSFGRLFQTLRTARGLNYGTYAYVEQYVQRGWQSLPENNVLRRQNHFYVWIRPTSVENGPFALRLALAEVERLVADGLDPDEFEATVQYLSGWVPLLAQDPGRRLAFALEAHTMGVPDILQTLPDALAALTVEEVNEAIGRHIHPEHLKIVVVTGDADRTRERLVEETETPIVYRDVTPDAAQAARDQEVASWPLALGADDLWIIEAEGIFQ